MFPGPCSLGPGPQGREAQLLSFSAVQLQHCRLQACQLAVVAHKYLAKVSSFRETLRLTELTVLPTNSIVPIPGCSSCFFWALRYADTRFLARSRCRPAVARSTSSEDLLALLPSPEVTTTATELDQRPGNSWVCRSQSGRIGRDDSLGSSQAKVCSHRL